jgi:hypothetical protein
VLIEAELDDLDELCALTGLEYVFDPADRIADRLGVATLERVAHREDWPPRDEIPRRRFDPASMRFGSAVNGETRGLWWYDGYRREEAWIRDEAGWWQVPIREYAPYLTYPHVGFLRYSRERQQLLVPSLVPLPPLQARAATLASGRLPRRSGTRSEWLYENITPVLAKRFTDSLATPLGAA